VADGLLGRDFAIPRELAATRRWTYPS
jgi:hypothetical protein